MQRVWKDGRVVVELDEAEEKIRKRIKKDNPTLKDIADTLELILKILTE